MQRPSAGYRGGTRASHQYSHNHHDENGNNTDENSSLSNSDDQQDRKEYLSSMDMNNDFESAIRNLRPSAVQQKKIKANLNISKQKADLPQLNLNNDENHHQQQGSSNEENHLPMKSSSSASNRWFPKADVGHVDSDDFIRHNHVGQFTESQQLSEVTDQPTPPALLTTIPPVGISTRPTAVIASAVPMRSISAFFSGSSAIKKGNGNLSMNIHDKLSCKTNGQQQQQQQISSPSAFQPIHVVSDALPKSITNKPVPLLMDIPQHKALERGQQLTKVHISHPQTPSIVHVNFSLLFI